MEAWDSSVAELLGMVLPPMANFEFQGLSLNLSSPAAPPPQFPLNSHLA